MTQEQPSAWFEKPREEVAGSVLAYHGQLYEQNSWRERDYAQLERMYENRYGIQVNATRVNHRPTYNVAKSATDTLHSQVVRSAVRPRIQANGGNKTMRDKAKNLQKWVDYQFRRNDVREEMGKVAHDALTYGTGAGKVYRDGTKIYFERVFPGELFVDAGEAAYGKPSQMLQTKLVDCHTLTKRFPDHKYAIKAAASSTRTGITQDLGLSGMLGTTPMVQVYEVWLLDGRGGTGKHALCIEGATLVFEDYKYDHFPFVFINHTDRKRAFWGIGVVEELFGLQVQIDTLMWRADEALRLATAPKMFVSRGANIKSDTVSNRIGEIVYYSGEKPHIYAPTPVSRDIWQQIDQAFMRGHQLVGADVGLMGQIPSGLETGAAVREAVDAGAMRFSALLKRWEQSHLKLANYMIELGKEIYKSNKNYSVVANKDKYTIAEVKWKDIDLEYDQYVLSVDPASSLPLLPSGRIAMVTDLADRQYISPATALRLIDFPDLDEELSLARAASDAIDQAIERMLDDGTQETPEPFMDLQLALKKVQTAYNRALSWDVPNERLALLRNYMNAVKQMMDQALAASAVGVPPAGAPVEPPAPGPNGAPPTAVQAGDGTMPL